MKSKQVSIKRLQRIGRTNYARVLQLAAAAVALQISHHAFAISDSYTGVDGGTWSAGANWTTTSSTHVAPVNGDDAVLGTATTVNSVIFNASNLTGGGLNSFTINNTGHASTTLTQAGSNAMIAVTENIGTITAGNIYNQSGGTNVTTLLVLGNTTNGGGTYTLSGTGSATATTFIAGNSGTGCLSVSGSGNLTTGNLTFGNNSTGNGNFTLSNTGVVSSTQFFVGNLGVGNANQSGGTLNISVIFGVGLSNTTLLSTYNMTGGNININNSAPFVVGSSGQGCMTQSAGNITFNGGLASAQFVIGSAFGSNGNYTLSGTGSLSGAAAEVIGSTGNGTFTQNGGNNTLAGGGAFIVGNQFFGVGNYFLNSGNLSVTTGNESIGAGGAGTFTQIGGSNFLSFFGGSLYIGQVVNSLGNYSLQGGCLTTSFAPEYVGYAGTGTFFQSGGTNSISTASTSGLILGNSVGGVGCYTLSGTGVLTSGGNQTIGFSGNGTFTQVAGSNSLTNTVANLILGFNNGATGNYNLQTGNLTTAASEFVGYSGNGIFTQTGGNNAINTAAGDLFIAYNPGSNGNYNLQGGNLTVAGTEYISAEGTAIFGQSGGNNTITGALNIGDEGPGSYTLSNTGVLTVTGAEWVGEAFTISSFTQNNGTNNAQGGLTIALQQSATGNYVLANGTLNVSGGDEVVGDDGFGTFQQSGGFNLVTGSLILGLDSGGLFSGFGNYTLSNGTLSVTTGENIGPGDVGNFTQTGGINSVSGTGLTIGILPGDGYLLAGGTLNLSALNVNGQPAVFVWTGGTLNFTTSVTFDPSAGPATTSAAFGSSLNLTTGSVNGGTFNSPMNLIVTGTETIGGTAAFALTINAGSSDTATTINVATTGTLNLNGGTIASNVVNAGVFNSSGGVFTGSLKNVGLATFNSSLTISNGLNNLGNVQPINLATTLTLNGAGLNNTGSILLNGGTINATAASNAGLISGYGTLLAAPFTNSGTITQVGGNIFINSLSSGFNNTGAVNLASGLQLLIAGLPVTNDGFIGLNGGTLNVGPGITNASDGTINGPGKILGIFTNNGTLAVPAGNLNGNFGFANTGLVTLSSPAALLTGGGISNTGSIQGTGSVAAQILNNSGGTVEALGGTLTVTGPVTNAVGATLRTTTGTKLLMQGASVFPTNAGLIDLSGGTFDNSNHALDNTGTIAGYGVLAASTITNDGVILFTGGTATINANIINSLGKRIDIKFQPAFFTGNITNAGTIKTWNTTVTYTGTLTNTGAYTSDPATNSFQSNVISSGTITGGIGDVFNFSTGIVNNSGNFSNGGTLFSADNITNTGSFSQTGAQTWSSGTTFTNAGGSATFGSDTGSPTSSPLSILVTAGAVNFAASQHLHSLSINSGTVSILAGVTKTNSLSFAGSLNNWSGDIDLTSRKLIVEDTSATRASDIQTLRNQAAAGDLNIYSSTAAAAGQVVVISDNAIRMSVFPQAGSDFGGEVNNVDASSILITSAIPGDANLDGVVDIKDLQDLANHWQQPTTDWSQADFDNNGIVGIQDLQALANHWEQGANAGGGSGDMSFADALALVGTFGSSTPAPEPGSLLLLGFGMGLLKVRRRSSR